MSTILSRRFTALITTRQALTSSISATSNSTNHGDYTSVARFICSSANHHKQQQDESDLTSKFELEAKDGEKEAKEGENEAEEDDEDYGEYVNKETGEIGGPKGPEPTRYGDWEKGGRCSDF